MEQIRDLCYHTTYNNSKMKMITMPQLPKHQRTSNQYECLVDQIQAMRVQESTTYKISRDYLSDSMDEGYVVSTFTRQKMFSWAINVAHACRVELPTEVAITSINFLDRFLSNCDDDTLDAVLCSEYVFQLCAVACFAIALKSFARMNIDLNNVSDAICHGTYTAREIAQMELKILQGLSWNLNGPSAMDFVHAFLQLMPAQDSSFIELLTEEARVCVENAMASFPLALEKPSSIAYASILVALDTLERKQNDQAIIHPHDDDGLEWMHSIANVASLKADDCTVQFIQGILIRK